LHTPALELDYAEAFFSAVKTLLQRFPDVAIAIKLKREFTDPHRAFPSALLELAHSDSIWLRQGRLLILNTSIDPFLPVAICDAAIGMAFTSPVLAAISCGRHGIYYDPLGYAACPSEPAFRHITLRSPEQLFERVSEWLRGESRPLDPSVARLVPPPGPVDFTRIT